MSDTQTVEHSDSEPLFSVIIPTYNRAHLVTRAVRSVLDQEFDALEVIVLDDGSTDDTELAIRTIDDNRVRYEKLDHAGANRARNIGVRRARGNSLIFLDSDDEAAPGWLRAIAEQVESGSALVSTDCWSVGRSGMRRLGADEVGYPGSGVRGKFLSGTYAIDKGLFETLGGFADDLPSAQHTDLMFRLIEHMEDRALSTYHIDVPLITHHRDMTQSIRHDHRAVVEGTEYIIDKHSQILLRNPRRLANYHSVAGIGAMRLGEPRRARHHLYASMRADPTNIKRWARLLAASLPGASYLWRRSEHAVKHDAGS